MDSKEYFMKIEVDLSEREFGTLIAALHMAQSVTRTNGASDVYIEEHKALLMRIIQSAKSIVKKTDP